MKAYEWLNSSDRWCQGACAKDKDDRIVDLCNKKAEKRCIIGLLLWNYQWGNFLLATDKIKEHLATKDLAKWNDAPERTYEEVYDVLKKADV